MCVFCVYLLCIYKYTHIQYIYWKFLHAFTSCGLVSGVSGRVTCRRRVAAVSLRVPMSSSHSWLCLRLCSSSPSVSRSCWLRAARASSPLSSWAQCTCRSPCRATTWALRRRTCSSLCATWRDTNNRPKAFQHYHWCLLSVMQYTAL